MTRLAAALLASIAAIAAVPTVATAQTTQVAPDGWLARWMQTVDATRASQPHFPAPIVTSHVALVEQFRYDVSWQQEPGGQRATNFGASRGLELIPATRLEVALFPPPYITHQPDGSDGFGDLSFLVKYRVASAPEAKRDYFIGGFLGGSFPTSDSPNGTHHAVFSPTLALAKGFGPVDMQGTVAVSLAASGREVLGRAVAVNAAVDYKIKGVLWPMIEINSTSWSGGTNDGRQQVFITPGVVVGSYPLDERLRFSVATGVQIAVSEFHQYNHRWVASVRLPF